MSGKATTKKKICSPTTCRIQDLIIREMKRQGVSYRKLASEVGCSTMAIVRWKNHEQDITIGLADRALKALGIAATIGAEEEKKGKA